SSRCRAAATSARAGAPRMAGAAHSARSREASFPNLRAKAGIIPSAARPTARSSQSRRSRREPAGSSRYDLGSDERSQGDGIGGADVSRRRRRDNKAHSRAPRWKCAATSSGRKSVAPQVSIGRKSIWPRRPAAACISALFALAAAIALRWLLDPVLADSLPFVTLFGAVAAAVWLAGDMAGIVVALGGYAAANYLFIPPRGGLQLATSEQVIGLVAYLFTGAIIIA